MNWINHIAIIMMLPGFFHCVAKTDENILHQENLVQILAPDSQWKLGKNMTAEPVNDKMRIFVTGEPGNALLAKQIFLDLTEENEYRFLQVFMGSMEHSETSRVALSSNSQGGKYMGRLFPGWNTFDLRRQKAYLGKKGLFNFFFIQYAPEKSGEVINGWVDYGMLRIVKVPYEGLTVILLRNGEEFAGPGEIGDQLRFTFHSSHALMQSELPVTLIMEPMMSEYRVSKDKIVLKPLSPREYQADVSIDQNAIAINTTVENITYILSAAVTVNGEQYYGKCAAPLHIRTEHSFPSPFKGTPLTIKYRNMWQEATRGNNLAAGKPVQFSAPPTYHLTAKGNSDETDLTDGILVNNEQDFLWWHHNAVGWLGGPEQGGVNLLIDLQEKKKLDKLVIRILGSRLKDNMTFPELLECYISNDGIQFHRASSLSKLQLGEKELSDFSQRYFLEENDTAYVFPFALKLNAEARYVGLKVFCNSQFLFMDELAVLEATRMDEQFNAATQTVPERFLMRGVEISSRIGYLAVPTNVLCPNRLIFRDMRNDSQKRASLSAFMELPDGVEPLEFLSSELIDGGKRFLLKHLKPGEKAPGSLVVTLRTSSLTGADLKAVAYAQGDGVEAVKTIIPIQLYQMAEVTQPFRRLHISLAWMAEREACKWPNFQSTWKKLGFNCVSTFPRYWGKSVPADIQQWLDESRRNGFKVIMNESPFHEMRTPERTAGHEIYSQIPAVPNRNLCPSYRGRYFTEEMERVYLNVKLSRPDYVFWDIECWYGGSVDASRCERCQAAFKDSGLSSMAEFLKACGIFHNQSLTDTVKRAAEETGIDMPLIASYDRWAGKTYQYVSDFDQLYPDYLKVAQPSLYVGGQAQIVHNAIRSQYEILKNRDIIPWLTPGCYGEFDPKNMEQMVLEALLNGACGITYYASWEFDTSLDYHYHAKALAAIAPYEDLIMDGAPCQVSGSDATLTYSAIRHNNEMLLLIGNYSGSPEKTTQCNLPFENIREIRDLRSNTKLGNLQISVLQNDIRLLYVNGE